METATATKRPSFDIRRLTADNKTREFQFLVIDTPEKWLPASSYAVKYEMGIAGSPKKLRFHLKGLSLADWQVIEDQFPVPDEYGESKETKARSKKEREDALDQRKIGIFERVLCQVIPGGSHEEKMHWLDSRNPGEVQALLAFAQNQATAFVDAGLVADYSSFAAGADTASTALEFTSFEDWSKASDSQYFFRLSRYDQDFIVEFPLKAISAETKRKIEAETQEPEPPQMPWRNPETGRLDPRRMEPNVKDPGWIKATRAIHQRRTAMYIDECLTFSIPGENYQQKYIWLSERLMGDVVRLKNYILQEMLGFGSRYNFF